MIPINKRKIGIAILLSIITCGIYYIYWEYLLVKNIRALKNDSSSCTSEMLCMILVPFYPLYWWFTRGKAVEKAFAENNCSVTGSGTVYLILALFGLSIISMCIMQNDFNSLPDGTFQAVRQSARFESRFGKVKQTVSNHKKLVISIGAAGVALIIAIVAFRIFILPPMILNNLTYGINLNDPYTVVRYNLFQDGNKLSSYSTYADFEMKTGAKYFGYPVSTIELYPKKNSNIIEEVHIYLDLSYDQKEKFMKKFSRLLKYVTDDYDIYKEYNFCLVDISGMEYIVSYSSSSKYDLIKIEKSE